MQTNKIKKEIVLKNLENIRKIIIMKYDLDHYVDFNITFNNIKKIDLLLLKNYDRFYFYDDQNSFNSLLENIKDIDILDNIMYIRI